jgi:hypothetical protein
MTSIVVEKINQHKKMRPQTIAPTRHETFTITSILQTPATRIRYRRLGRKPAAYGVPANVLLERRVLKDFREIDPDLGDDTAGVILSLLAFDLATKPAGDGRLPVCLVRRSDEKIVEVELMVLRRQKSHGEHLYLRLAGVHELPVNA